MHVNTTSAFNVNYKIAVTCIKFHWQFHKMFCESHNEHLCESMCLKRPPPTRTYLWWPCYWSFAVSMMSWSKSNQVCIKRFHSSSTSWIFISCTAHDDPCPLWWSYGHLMQCSLVISCCNITFLVFWLLWGSVATLIRWGGLSSYCHMYHSFVILTVKAALKSIDFWQSYREK